MECCDQDPIRIKEPTSRVVKTGYLTIYERGLFVNGWKDRYFKLYADSSLLWYHGNDDEHHKAGIRLKMVANYIAVGPMCLHSVGFPKLPKGRHVIHLMGVPDIFKKNTKRKNLNMNWILFPMDEGNMQAWLQAIKPTLPSPPSRPDHPYHSINKHQIKPDNTHHSINGHQVRPEHPHHSFNEHQVRPEHHHHPSNGTQVTSDNTLHIGNGNQVRLGIAPESSNGDQMNLYPTVDVVRYQPIYRHIKTRDDGTYSGIQRDQPEYRHINTRDERTYSGIQRGVILKGGALPHGIGAYGPGMGWEWGWGWGPNTYGGFWGSLNDLGDCGSVNIDHIVDDLCKQNNNYGYDIKDIREFERGNFSNTTNGGSDGSSGDEIACNECWNDCCKCNCSDDSCCASDGWGEGGGVGGAGTEEYTGGDCGCGC